MPKINEVVAQLDERVKTLTKELEAVDAAHSDTSQKVHDLRREFEKEIALLKREIEELRNWKDEQKKEHDERGRRLWAFGPSLLGAIVGGLIAAAVAYFIRR